MKDVIIAGGGPTGCFAGEKLAEKGFSVAIFEEHPEIGLPQHCTGIVSQKFSDHFDIPHELVQKKVTSFTIISPLGEMIRAPGKVNALAINRVGFDRRCAEKARTAGAELYLASKIIDVKQKSDRVTVVYSSHDRSYTMEGKLLIVACGSMSSLPSHCGVGLPVNHFIHSIQAEGEISGIDGAELYLGRKFAAGSFAFAVSISGSHSKLGIIGKHGITKGFNELIGSPYLKDRIRKIEDRPCRRKMPLGLARRTVNGRIIAVGDAAGQVKTTTGGGLYFGLLCSSLLCDVVKSAWTQGDFSLQKLNEYDGKWKSAIGKEIRIGLLLRRFLEIISDRDLHGICTLLQRKPFSDILEKHVDFDYHQHFLSSLIKVPEFHKGFISSAISSLRKMLLKG